MRCCPWTIACGLMVGFSIFSIANSAPSTLKVAACDPGLNPFVEMNNGTLRGYDLGKIIF